MMEAQMQEEDQHHDVEGQHEDEEMAVSQVHVNNVWSPPISMVLYSRLFTYSRR